MKFFFNMGEGTPFPLDILCKNLVNFYKFSRFISEKINSFYQNMFQLMFEKNKKKCELSHFWSPPLKSVKLKNFFFHTLTETYFGKKNLFFHL